MLRSAMAPILRGRGFHATGARFGLLKGLNPLLTADLLHVLRSAGHGYGPNPHEPYVDPPTLCKHLVLT